MTVFVTTGAPHYAPLEQLDLDERGGRSASA
jgi:hypothetical protein